MSAGTPVRWNKLGALLLAVTGVSLVTGAARAQVLEEKKLTWDQSKSVYNRRIRPPEPAE